MWIYTRPENLYLLLKILTCLVGREKIAKKYFCSTLYYFLLIQRVQQLRGFTCLKFPLQTPDKKIKLVFLFDEQTTQGLLVKLAQKETTFT